MEVQGPEEYGGFYNSYRVKNIPIVDTEYTKKQNDRMPETEPEIPDHQCANTSSKIEEKKRIANLEDLSLTFNSEESFDYIGADSEISILDVQKAVSDMKKDQILEQYQYFYRSNSNDTILESEDGLVMQKINHPINGNPTIRIDEWM